MKRREFIKLATATVLAAQMPVALAAVMQPADIRWYVTQEPAYGYAWRVTGASMINGRDWTDGIIVDAKTITTTELQNAKESVMKALAGVER